ncbi:hypothetical protein Nepgr_003649 [Nepenthes gracilis]|uniref:Uncharacterized protein n=1 Tax=Nepenthes gracilis TaxID=150966 RepID=A0AAD3RZX7_NEPGR|nr:hypothetical protein Nepgr_003649 [Nepenthes gracilis]
MAESETEFPGFQVFVPEDEDVLRRRSLSRLQRRAPRPLQLKPPAPATFKCEGSLKAMASGLSSSPFTSFYQNKDPIPLLSPLTSPSLIDSSYACFKGLKDPGTESLASHSAPWSRSMSL